MNPYKKLLSCSVRRKRCQK